MLRSEVGGAKVAGIASNLDDSRQRVLMFPGGEKDLSRGRRNPRSKAAHDRLAPKKPSMRSAVFALLALAPEKGGTLKEIAHALSKPVHSISGRLTELAKLRMIYATDETRDGCTVWKARFAQ